MILEDTRNYSKQSKRYNESNQSQKSTKYKNKSFKDGSNNSRTNEMYSTVSLQNTNSMVRSQSNGLNYDKKNYIHTDSGNNF